jgi:hypothetical protein
MLCQGVHVIRQRRHVPGVDEMVRGLGRGQYLPGRTLDSRRSASILRYSLMKSSLLP